MRKKKILFVAMGKSNHTYRWINLMVDTDKYELFLFSSYNLLQYPKINYNKVKFYDLLEKKYTSFVFKAITRCFNKLSPRIKIKPSYFNELYLKCVIKLIKPDIIHSLHTQNSGFIVSNVKENWPKNTYFPQWIHSVWGSDLYLLGRFPDSAKEIEKMMPKVDYFLGEGKRDKILATKFGFSGTTLDSMPASGGFDLGNISSSQKPSLRKEISIKGYNFGVGRCQVGLRALVKAKDILKGYTINIFLSELDPIMIKLYEMDMGVKINVIPFGLYEEIFKMFARSRIYIGLSMSDGLPSSFLEAMLHGAFPIQSNTSVADEWIEDGISGILVPPEDPDIIEKAIRQALTDDELVNQAANNNFTTIKERASSTFLKQRVQEMYDHISKDNTNEDKANESQK